MYCQKFESKRKYFIRNDTNMILKLPENCAVIEEEALHEAL